MFCPSACDFEAIDRTSMRILSELGIRVDDEDLCQRALAAGARPGRSNSSLRLPPQMVRELVGMAPSKARFADCSGAVTALGRGTEPTFWTGAALNYTVGAESRPIGKGDLADFARVADSLATVFAVVGTSVAEAPPPARDFVGFRILAESTNKHLRPLLFTTEGVRPILEMAEVIADGRPLSECPVVSFGYSCVSPLHWTRIATDMWRSSSGHKLPVMVNGEPMAGATSPVTLAGSIAMANAEILAGVALIELLEPGRPVVHNLGFAHVLDMRTAACLSGAPECALMAYVAAKLAAYYRLPSASWMSTDSFLEDEQATLEKVLNGFAHVLGGVNVIWGAGQLESQKALSPVQLIIDDALIDMLLRFRSGLRFDDEALAFDVVERVVAEGGDFLSQDHTLASFREELSESPLMARTQREAWQTVGSSSLSQRAAARVEEILSEPRPPHLSEQQSRELRAIEERALSRIRLTAS